MMPQATRTTCLVFIWKLEIILALLATTLQDRPRPTQDETSSRTRLNNVDQVLNRRMDSLYQSKKKEDQTRRKKSHFYTQAANKVGGKQAAEPETPLRQQRMDHMQDAVSTLDVNWAALQTCAS